MTHSEYQEKTTSVIIRKSFALASRCMRVFGLMFMLVVLAALVGCGGKEATSAPDRSTVRGLAEYVLWTFRIDSIEEFEKVNPPMELIEQWVGKDAPDLPMVKAMAMGMRQDSLDHWKAIKKLASELGIDWQKTEIADVEFGKISVKKIGGVNFQESDGAGVFFETNGKRWGLGLDDPMRRGDGPWYFRDGLRWSEEHIRAAIRAPADSTSKPSDLSMQRLQADAAKTLNTKVNTTLDLGKGVTMKLVLIPAGKFLMGSKYSAEEVVRRYGGVEDFYAREHPQHEVTISKSFYMGMYEVTQSQWCRTMDTEPWDGKEFTKSGADNPATWISWDDANKFCQMLSKTTGKDVGLPTEAQWEYACRAGSNTAYYFGDYASKLGNYAWYQKNTFDKEEIYDHAVGRKKSNAWGLYDMHGNVREWCRDWYDAKFYAKAKKVDPENITKAECRVVRGGGWIDDSSFCRAAFRNRHAPGCGGIGFRVVIEIK